MPRVRYTVTPAWQEVNGGLACVITADVISKKGHIQFNESASPDTALNMLPNPNVQVIQTENKPVFVRSDVPGYEIVVDISTPA